MAKVGRKPGKRTKNYELAIKDYMLGKGNISELALRYNVDRSGLSKAINSTDKSKYSTENKTFNGGTLKEFVTETKANILNGIEHLETLKNSSNKLHNDIAEDIMEELRTSDLKTAKFIHALGQRLLKDFLEVTNKLREDGEMDLKNINFSLKTLETANNFLGIPKSPLIAIQNNIQNNNKGLQEAEIKKPIDININFVKKDDKNKIKNDTIINIENNDNKV